MPHVFLAVRALVGLAVFSFLSTSSYALDPNDKSASFGADNQCNIIFSKTKSSYFLSNVKAKMLLVEGNNASLYSLVHNFNNLMPYSMWESLNGEVQGYVLRSGSGIDYNLDRNIYSPLSWHPTQIWDRIFDENIDFKSFSCVMTGRVRLAGYKATLIRLVPQDGLRYTYLIARDDDSLMPIELIILNPDGSLVSKITAIGYEKTDAKFPIDDEIINDNIASRSIKKKDSVWKELNIPKAFKLQDFGKIIIDSKGNESLYQEFSDGITSFRVYKSPRMSLYVPAISHGSISIYRQNKSNYEYAVVGEVSMNLCESVLSKLNL